MNRDPIVEEIHKTRRKMLDECNGKLELLLERYKAAEEQDLERTVTFESLQTSREGPKTEA